MKRDLELEIENFQIVLYIPYKVEEKVGDLGGDDIEMLQSMVGEIKGLWRVLSYFQEENETFLKNRHLRQLQNNTTNISNL